MPKFERLVAMLPCYGLESFDLQRKEDDAEQLLSAWSALWHPRLLASARSIPRWMPASSPTQDPAGHLIMLPDCCEASLAEGWLAQAEAAGACVLRNLRHRDDMVAAALERLDDDQPAVDPELVADFLALGFCHLQVELLTRKMRYMSNLDESSFQNAVLAATEAAVKGEVEAAKEHLQTAFDRLHDAREYFYPTNARLLDLTLVAPTTSGEPLRNELSGSLPCNVLVAGEVIEMLAEREPDTLAVLKQALADNRAALLGGEHTELPLPLLSPEAIEVHLRRGLATYEKHLERRPRTFGRRRFGLTPALPQILASTSFNSAFHCTLDDGQFPTANQCRIQWEGIDGTTIEAIGRLPLDANRSESFLGLAETLNNAMNLDQSAAIVFAHWPGRASCWYADMRRIAAYGSVLGEFMTITEYFDRTTATGKRSHYKPDQYRSPYLAQDVAAGRRDPISRWVRYFGRRATLDAGQSLGMLADVLCRTEGGGRKAEGDDLAAAVAASLVVEDDTAATLDKRLAEALEEPLADLAKAIVGTPVSNARGSLAVNPWSFAQQVAVESAIIDVPAMGFAWRDSVEAPTVTPTVRKGWFGKRTPQLPPPLAEEHVLRNEFFEAYFDPHTGAIRMLSDYHSRAPRLAQQIALRLPQGGEPGDDVNYSIMAADQWIVSSSGPTLGEIICRGRLLDREGRRVAGFQQTTRAWRGSRILEICIDLDVERQPGPNPWDSYYAVRFAWKDETAVLYRDTNLANLPTELTQFESPLFVDICRPKQRTTLLSAGLPFHRRFGLRKLDTLLLVQGETARSFRLGVGIDVPSPTAAAIGLMAPPLTVPDQPSPPTSSGWLFHLDCRNVLATRWESSRRANEPGFRVRLQETDGHGVKLALRCLRRVASAKKINPGNVPPVELVVEGDRVDVSIGPHQSTEIEVRFA